jgi:hypothetical protein
MLNRTAVFLEMLSARYPGFGFKAGYDPLRKQTFLWITKDVMRFIVIKRISLTKILDKNPHNPSEFYPAVFEEIEKKLASIQETIASKEKEEGREVMPLARVLTENEMRQLRSMEAIEHVRVSQMEEDHND